MNTGEGTASNIEVDFGNVGLFTLASVTKNGSSVDAENLAAGETATLVLAVQVDSGQALGVYTGTLGVVSQEVTAALSYRSGI